MKRKIVWRIASGVFCLDDDLDVRSDLHFSQRFDASRLQIWDCLNSCSLVANCRRKKAALSGHPVSEIHPLLMALH